MRITRFTRCGAAGIASVALAGALALGMAQNVRAESTATSEKTLEGTWWVQVSLLTDCVSRTPLTSFAALLTFAKGGTMTGATTNASFAVGQRSGDHGIWSRNAAHTYTASSVALLLFTSPPNFPVSPGFAAGSQRLDQAIELTDDDHFTSDAVTTFFDVNGAEYRDGCATALGRRFQ
ncbi:MAG TPA: hypothetical protein VG222_07190 [Vicinamibacterales bacterium]|nr:hypothetical protein [Vicinamibacterales bacterium]